MDEEVTFTKAVGVVEVVEVCPKCKQKFRSPPGDDSPLCPYCANLNSAVGGVHSSNSN